jgi:PAS domain-containing protein
MEDAKNKKRRGLEEVAHFFLSQQQFPNREIDFCINEADVPLSCLSLDSISSKRDEGSGLNDSAHEFRQGFTRFQKLAEKSDDGFILLDQDKIVSLVNPAAEFLLGIHDEKLCGQLFNYFIQENEPVQVGIFRENRNRGIGEMQMKKTDWEGETSYLISIHDITDRLRTAEGLSSASVGDH